MSAQPHRERGEQWETRAGLRAIQTGKLQALLREIGGANAFWARRLADAGVTPDGVRSLADLRRLPFVNKAEIVADQLAQPPYGTNLTYPLARYTRVHQTSGTTGEGLRWLDTPESWSWFLDCWQIIYDAVGLRPDDRLLFAFSFGPFIGFWAAFEAAQRRGNFCIATGGMSSTARLRMLLQNRATALLCTPTYALHLAEAASGDGVDLTSSPVRMLIVAGEPGGSVPGTRDRIERAYGARVFDHTGMTEIGPLGVECHSRPGSVHMIESECIVELVDPATGRATLQAGDEQPADSDPLEGELVLTNLGRLGSPLLRYRTGDVVRLQSGPCACGRHFVRLVGGIIGRSDDMFFVRGNNVYPSAMDSVIRAVAGVAEYQVLIGQSAELTTVDVNIEPAAGQPDAAQLVQAVTAAIRERLFFNANVRCVAPGTLPRFEMKARRFVRRSVSGDT